MKTLYYGIGAVAMVVFLAAPAPAGLATFTFSGSDCYDTFIAPGRLTGGWLFGGSTINYGASDYFGANEGASARGLLRFDVSSLAGQYGAVISMELRLYQEAGGAANVSAYRINDANSNWQEGLVAGQYTSYGDWWGRTTYATKLRDVPDNSWDGGSGMGSGGYDTVALATGTTSGGAWTSLFLNTDMTALMDEWVQSPVVGAAGRFAEPEQYTNVANEGFLLTSDGYVQWSSSEGAFSPELVVTVVSGMLGDFDGDNDVDADDIDILANAIEAGSTDLAYDLDADADVDEDDMIFHIAEMVEVTTGGVGTYRGDFIPNGYVNSADLAILKANFGSTEGLGFAQGNCNPDSVIDATDLAILKATYGLSGTPGGWGNPPAVPEPATLTLLGLGAMALLRRRKRQ